MKPDHSSSTSKSSPLREETTLSLQELQRIERLTSEDQGELWAALGRLLAFLSDRLVVVEATRQPADRPHRLTVFTMAGTLEAFAVVGLDGTVVVGRVDRLRAQATQRLDGFDPLAHEVTSVVVTDDRLVGDRVDLWIGVRRPVRSSPAFVAYHAVVWLGHDGSPRIEPADDQGAATSSQLQPLPASRFPSWFTRWAVTTSGRRIREELSQDVLAEMSSGLGWREVVAVEWQDDRVLVALEDEIRVLAREAPVLTLKIYEPARAVALVPGAGRATQGLVSFDARTLMAFTTEEGLIGPKLREEWWQRRHDRATGLGFLAHSPRAPDSPWPDLLGAYADGRLERLRCLGEGAIRGHWETCWKKLGLTTAHQRIDAAREREKMPETERSALLLGVVERLLTEAAITPPEQLDSWLKDVDELCRPNASERVLQPLVDCLLREIETFATRATGSPRRELPRRQGDFLPALLYKIYDQYASIGQRETIDQTIRHLPWRDEVKGYPWVKKLLERSHVSRRDIVKGKPETARKAIEHIGT